MADAEAPCAATEAAVGDERAVRATTGSLQGSSDGQHLAHARPALGAFVPDHEHGAGLNRSGEDRLHRGVLAVEHAGNTLEQFLLLAQTGNFHDGSPGCQGTGEDVDAALCVDRLIERVHDHAVRRRGVDGGQVLRDRLAGHGDAVTVEQSCVEEVLHHHRHAADSVEVAHVELAARLHVRDVRHLRRDSVEVLELQGNACFVGDGQQVQHSVGAAPERARDGNGILKRRLRHDLARRDAEPQQVHHGLARKDGIVLAPPVDGRRAGRPRKAHPDRLGDGAHRVGGEHATARALPGAGLALDLAQLGFGDGAHGARTDGLEHAGDVEGHAIVVAGHDAAVVDEHTREVEPG